MKRLGLVVSLIGLLFMLTPSPTLSQGTNVTAFYTNSPPNVLDGVKGDEWNVTGSVNYRLFNDASSTNLEFWVVHNNTHIFFAMEFNDSNQVAQEQGAIILDIDEDNSWGLVGGGSDNFDVLLGSYLGSYSILDGNLAGYWDGYSNDISNSGSSDTIGNGSYTNNTYFWEFRHEMNSEDNLNDVSLQVGDTILIMPVVQNDVVAIPPLGLETAVTLTISSNIYDPDSVPNDTSSSSSSSSESSSTSSSLSGTISTSTSTTTDNEVSDSSTDTETSPSPIGEFVAITVPLIILVRLKRKQKR